MNNPTQQHREQGTELNTKKHITRNFKLFQQDQTFKAFGLSSPTCHEVQKNQKQTPWPESANELYPQSDCSLSAKLVPTFSDRGCQVVSVTDLYGRILGFLDRNRYFFFQVLPQFYSRGSVAPFQDHYFSEAMKYNIKQNLCP
jgi:hypothetical protein